MFTKDRKISYYASQLSENISETPEGYLICRNVPIARTGVQEYLGQEIGITDKYDQMVKVYREEEDVFAPEAIASFEGKPFTNNHPEPMVDVNNLPQYGKGHAQNIRRSSTEPDLLVADIVATDPLIISEIKNKIKREISSGYDCYYVPYKDGYRQVEIRGNHIALVSKGRAGDRVSIKDNLTERKSKMAKKNILAAMLKAFAKDADPDEVAAAVDALNQKDAEEEKAKLMEVLKKPEKSTEDEEGGSMESVMGRLDALEERLNKLFASKQEEADEDPEENPDLSEEEVKEEVKETEDSCDEDIEEEGEEKMVVSKDTLDSLRVAVARIRNPQDKRRASDALLKVYGRSKPATNIYDSVAKLSAASKKTQDNAPENLEDLGKKIAAKWNPHYKQGE